jgi:hypothetical protein
VNFLKHRLDVSLNQYESPVVLTLPRLFANFLKHPSLSISMLFHESPEQMPEMANSTTDDSADPLIF